MLRPFIVVIGLTGRLFLYALILLIMAGSGHFLPGGKVSYGASRP